MYLHLFAGAEPFRQRSKQSDGCGSNFVKGKSAEAFANQIPCDRRGKHAADPVSCPWETPGPPRNARPFSEALLPNFVDFLIRFVLYTLPALI